MQSSIFAQSPASGRKTLAITAASTAFSADRIQPQACDRLAVDSSKSCSCSAWHSCSRWRTPLRGRPAQRRVPCRGSKRPSGGLDGQAQVPAGRLAGGGSPAARRRGASHTLTHAALGAVFEAGALLGVVKAARALPPGASSAIARLKILPSDTIKGLPAAEWFAWCVIIFGSSAVGSAVDGSLRAATNQILMPTRVAGEQGWYASLDKPRWEPPAYVFPVMWLLVSKPTQLLAVAKVCSSGTSEGEEAAALPWVPQLAAYCLHLALGDAWNKVFFGQQKVAAGALMITVFYGALLASAYLFSLVDPMAGLLMVPTCVEINQ